MKHSQNNLFILIRHTFNAIDIPKISKSANWGLTFFPVHLLIIISFTEQGERVILLRKLDHNWYEGRLGAKKGIFPVSYVQVMREPQELAASRLLRSFMEIKATISVGFFN